jgi:hypothetical protein
MRKLVSAAIGLSVALSACGGGGGSSPPPPIVVTFTTAPPSSIATSATASMAALVSNDPNDNGVTWSASCSTSECGSFSPTESANAEPTTYTAPATIPSPATVTITATSVTDTSKSVSATVTVTSSAQPVLADGTYVLHLSGTDANGSYTVAGAFTLASGVITGGEQDFSDPNGGYTDTLSVKTSSLNVTGGTLQLTLDTGNSAIGVNGVETIRGIQVSATRVLISEFDLSAAGTGSIDLQTGAAAPANGYAFAISGNDTAGEPLAIGGVIDISGSTVAVAGSVFDLSVFKSNNAATAFYNQSFASGSVTKPDSYGRIQLTLTPSAASTIPSFGLAGYIVGPQRIELVESIADSLNANTGGSALGQGSNTGRFSLASASVLNQSYAPGSGGIDPNGVAVLSGAFALYQNGVLGGTLALNDLANVGAWNVGGSYAVYPTGRVTVSVTSLSSATAPPPAKTLSFALYLDGNGNAMIIGIDAFQTTQGIAFEQGNNFSLSGPYALSGQGAVPAGGAAAAWSAVGPASVTNASVSGTTDFTVVTAAPQSAVALSGTANTTTSMLQLSGLNPNDFTMSDSFAYYPLSGNRLWALQVDKQGVGLLLLEGVTPP